MATKLASFQMIELMPRDQWNVETRPTGCRKVYNEKQSPEEILGQIFMSMVSDEEAKTRGNKYYMEMPKLRIEHTAVDNMDLSVFSPTTIYKDALLSAVMSAFNNHHPIVFTPDLVYGYLAKGIAIHIEKFPEELRSLFVSHEGKEDLKYRNDSFRRGSKNNDWADMFKNFADELKEKTKENSVVQNDLRFSTSTPMTEAHRHVLSMECMKSYFDFKCYTACGMSCVILEGTLEDWKLLQKIVTSQLTEINKYCENNPKSKAATLDWWSPVVEVMLENFVTTYETQAQNKSLPNDLKCWWSKIYKFNEAQGSGTVATVTGWLNTLYPYIRKNIQNPWIVHSSAVIKYNAYDKFKSFFKIPKFSFRRRHRQADEVELADYPSYVASVPFTWFYYEQKHKMNILIGYALLGQVAVEGSLYPKGTLKVFPSWIIYYKEEENETVEEESS